MLETFASTVKSIDQQFLLPKSMKMKYKSVIFVSMPDKINIKIVNGNAQGTKIVVQRDSTMTDKPNYTNVS